MAEEPNSVWLTDTACHSTADSVGPLDAWLLDREPTVGTAREAAELILELQGRQGSRDRRPGRVGVLPSADHSGAAASAHT